MPEIHGYVLFALLRVVLGVLFLFQGLDKVIRVGLKKTSDTFIYEMRESKLPRSVVVAGAYISSLLELLGGALLIPGLFTSYALFALGFDLILVTIAFSMIRPVWDMQFVFPRLVILAALLYLPLAWNAFSVDYFLF